MSRSNISQRDEPIVISDDEDDLAMTAQLHSVKRRTGTYQDTRGAANRLQKHEPKRRFYARDFIFPRVGFSP